MRILTCLAILTTFCSSVHGQQFLNGSFENNTAGVDQVNISNAVFNSIMTDNFAFGYDGNVDIIRSSAFCGTAQQGSWYIAITGGGSDAVTFALSQPLIKGLRYQVSFYDRICLPNSQVHKRVQIGVSDNVSDFGVLVGTASSIPSAAWKQQKISFVAPSDAPYITVKTETGGESLTWVHVDNFSLSCEGDINLGEDRILCDGETLLLSSGMTQGDHLWQDGSTQTSFLVQAPGTYSVTVTAGECQMGDQIRVSYKRCVEKIYLPSGFTPNDDGLNDQFIASAIVDDFELKVFNRWGQLVFVSKDASKGWDGRSKGQKQPNGVYIYTVRYKNINGEIISDKGVVSLIR